MCRCQFYIYDERKDENYQSGCKMKAKKHIGQKNALFEKIKEEQLLLL